MKDGGQRISAPAVSHPKALQESSHEGHPRRSLSHPFRGCHPASEDAFLLVIMSCDLKKRIKSCERYIRRGAAAQRAPMSTIVTTTPLELISIDFLNIKVKEKQQQDILIIMDHFTRFAQAICAKD